MLVTPRACGLETSWVAGSCPLFSPSCKMSRSEGGLNTANRSHAHLLHPCSSSPLSSRCVKAIAFVSLFLFVSSKAAKSVCSTATGKKASQLFRGHSHEPQWQVSKWKAAALAGNEEQRAVHAMAPVMRTAPWAEPKSSVGITGSFSDAVAPCLPCRTTLDGVRMEPM